MNAVHCHCCHAPHGQECCCWENEPCLGCGQCSSHCRCVKNEEASGQELEEAWSREDLEFDGPGSPFAEMG